MGHKDLPQGVGEQLSEILDVDRVLDELGRGASVDGGQDPLLNLLVAARAEADADMPEPPLVSEGVDDPAPGGGGRRLFGRRHLRRGSVFAATAGGVGVASILVAGVAAATIAVGGIATYNFIQPRLEKPVDSPEVAPNEPGVDQDGDATDALKAKKTAEPGAGEKSPEEDAARDSREDAPKDPAEDPSRDPAADADDSTKDPATSAAETSTVDATKDSSTGTATGAVTGTVTGAPGESTAPVPAAEPSPQAPSAGATPGAPTRGTQPSDLSTLTDTLGGRIAPAPAPHEPATAMGATARTSV
ncbi:hypothetical protein GC425_03935 [Corynebacterium sp. zg254]|uniref:Uncharacterized protein n=1 Tax=Corynebacterium zhongnanshanii TaxID=2768834 RepID=A0ABQ6VF46_9CORY|nr:MULTISPECIES: hypothetical protein [Corynebacterium]KAB3522905.1 hypothetical protein F8377_01685 [Corynebacterium zhongnanshanii]MCR5914020.1 hypothetical protein [Corynebacterium sp. zg254]